MKNELGLLVQMLSGYFDHFDVERAEKREDGLWDIRVRFVPCKECANESDE